MTHDLCYMLFFIIVTNINTPIRQSILRDTRAPFSLSPVITRLRSQDWGFIFWELAPHVNKCRVTLAICYSLGLKSLTHNHSTRAGPVRTRCAMIGVFDRKWKAVRISVVVCFDFGFTIMFGTSTWFLCHTLYVCITAIEVILWWSIAG